MSDCTATGTAVLYLPPGPECDELLELIRLGVKFKAQQVGKRPDFLTRYIASLTRKLKPQTTFAALLDELEREAARREIHGEHASPVEKVNRVFELVTFHHPKRGRVQVPFKTFQNKLTGARKIILAEQIPVSPKPGISARTLPLEARASARQTEEKEHERSR